MCVKDLEGLQQSSLNHGNVHSSTLAARRWSRGECKLRWKKRQRSSESGKENEMAPKAANISRIYKGVLLFWGCTTTSSPILVMFHPLNGEFSGDPGCLPNLTASSKLPVLTLSTLPSTSNVTSMPALLNIWVVNPPAESHWITRFHSIGMCRFLYPSTLCVNMCIYIYMWFVCIHHQFLWNTARYQ